MVARILIVENRYMVRLYEHLVEHWIGQGHEVHWIVQNPMFNPKKGIVHRLKFPKFNDLDLSDGTYQKFASIINVDRNINYFGGSQGHYEHYYKEIEALVDRIEPTVIFGEPTQFHELMVIRIARQRGMLYLVPATARYPVNRICFLKFDTGSIFGGSMETVSDHEVDRVIEHTINNIGKSVNIYQNNSGLSAKALNMFEKARIFTGWFLGERYVTPSPWVKYGLEVKRKKMQKDWDAFALDVLPKNIGNDWVLYSMHVQPESNIDVWGRPWNDQKEIIRRAAEGLQKVDRNLVVKPHPYGKYEITEELIGLVQNTANVIPLKSTVRMSDIFEEVPVLLGVSGTVIFEGMLSGKQVGYLGDPGLGEVGVLNKLTVPEQITELSISNLNHLSRPELRKYFKRRLAQTYPGDIYDPLMSLRNKSKNDKLLMAAFDDVIEAVECRGI